MGNKNNTYIPSGMSALFEAMNNAEYAEQSSDEMTNVVMGVTESATYLDAIDIGLMSEDQVENDMNVDSDFVTDSDRELFNKIDSILPEDDEDIDLDELDSSLESYIAANDATEDLYEYDY